MRVCAIVCEVTVHKRLTPTHREETPHLPACFLLPPPHNTHCHR